MRLVVAALSCPIVGIDGHTLHRVDTGGLPLANWATAATATARCGLSVKLLEEGGAPVRWGDIRTRGTAYKRCPACKKQRSPTPSPTTATPSALVGQYALRIVLLGA